MYDFSGFNLNNAFVKDGRIVKSYQREDGFTKDESLWIAKETQLFVKHLGDAGLHVPASDVSAVEHGNLRKVVITSDFLGPKNASDVIYEAKDKNELIETISLVLDEIVKAQRFTANTLNPDELAFGFDTGLYNFVIHGDDAHKAAYYIDFYPPRNRLDSNGQRRDKVITDYPMARSEEHHNNLLRNFYSKEGMWVHTIGHLIAAVESNPVFAHEAQTLVMDAVNAKLDAEHLDAVKEQVAKNSGAITQLATNFLNHRESYYDRFMVRKPTVLLIAAGKGERLKPYTDNLPKSLVPINNIPMLEYILNDAMQISPRKVILAVANESEARFRDYMKQHWSDVDYEIVPVSRGGVGLAISELHEAIDPRYPLIIGMGDVITRDGFKAVFEHVKDSRNAEKNKETRICLATGEKAICQKPQWSWAKVDEAGKLHVHAAPEGKEGEQPLIGLYGINNPHDLIAHLKQKIDDHKSGRLSDEEALCKGVIGNNGEYRFSPAIEELGAAANVSLAVVPHAVEVNTKSDLQAAKNQLSGSLCR